MVKRIIAGLSVVLLAVLPAACGEDAAAPLECDDAIGCVEIAPGEPIKFGVLQDMSGGAVTWGLDQVRGIEIAVARRDNRFLGHPIVLLMEDSGCSAEGGRVAAEKLVSDPDIVALLGPTCSGAATEASRIMSEAGLVMVSGAGSAPSLTSLGGERGADWQPGFFRTIHNNALTAQMAATFAWSELGVTRVATINDGDTYTTGASGVFGQVFTELGGEIVLEATVNKGDSDMNPVLEAVAASGAETVFLALFPPEAAHVVAQAGEVDGLASVKLVGAATLVVDAFIGAAGEAGAGMYFADWELFESTASDELVSEWESRYGEQPLTTAYGAAYDSVNMLLNALEAVAVQEEDGTLHIGRQALRDALYNTSGLEGVAGTLTCDEFGDCGAARFNVVRLDDPSAGLEGLKANVVYSYTPDQ